MLAGDAGQQQPFLHQNGKIMQINSALDNTSFLTNSYHYHLNQQHRVGDVYYLRFLNTIRKWVPTQELLDQIQDGHVISKSDTVTHDDILNAYYCNPDTTVLTFTKNAAIRVNQVIIEAIFSDQQPLARVQLD